MESFDARHAQAVADYNRVGAIVSDFYARYNGVPTSSIDRTELKRWVDENLFFLQDINICLQQNQKYIIADFNTAAGGVVHDIKNSVLFLSRLLNEPTDVVDRGLAKSITRLLRDHDRIQPIKSVAEIVYQPRWVGIAEYRKFDGYLSVIPEDVALQIDGRTENPHCDMVDSDLAYHLLFGELATNYRKYGCSGRCVVRFTARNWFIEWTNTRKEVEVGTHSGGEGMKILAWCVERLRGKILACGVQDDGFVFRAQFGAPVED